MGDKKAVSTERFLRARRRQTPKHNKYTKRYQLFNFDGMNRFLLIIMSFFLFACNEKGKNESQIRNNSELIKIEFLKIEQQYLLNKTRIQNFYQLAKEIKSGYDIIVNEYLEGKPFNENEANKLIDKFTLINESESREFKIPEMKSIDEESNKIFQIQYLTLYFIKHVKESAFSKDYSTNSFIVEPIKIGDKIKIRISQIDTTMRPCIMIGKLKENKKEFFDNFVMARYNGYYPEISVKDINNSKTIEGLFIIPTIEGRLDTIVFRKEINSW